MIETKTCTKCNEAKSLDCFYTYTDTRNGKRRQQAVCKPCKIKYVSKFQSEHWEQTQANKRAWKRRHPDQVREAERERVRRRQESDAAFRRRKQLRSLLHWSVFRTGTSEDAKVGCSVEELQDWLEHQFEPGMSWDNYGRDGWSFDHVVPWTVFDMTIEAEERLASNWTNVRPMWMHDNRLKSNHIRKDEVLAHVDKVKRFIDENPGYQTSIATCWWQRIHLWYGKNPSDCKDDSEFEEFLRRTIRNQACFVL